MLKKSTSAHTDTLNLLRLDLDTHTVETLFQIILNIDHLSGFGERKEVFTFSFQFILQVEYSLQKSGNTYKTTGVSNEHFCTSYSRVCVCLTKIVQES